jgi:hypothetical protein
LCVHFVDSYVCVVFHGQTVSSYCLSRYNVAASNDSMNRVCNACNKFLHVF